MFENLTNGTKLVFREEGAYGKQQVIFGFLIKGPKSKVKFHKVEKL